MRNANGKRMALLIVLLLSVLYATVVFATDGTLVLPEDLEIIETQAFYGLSDVTTVIVPDCVEEIGNQAFGGSTSLRIVEVSPDLFENPEDPDEVSALEARILTNSPNARIVVRADTGDFEWEAENGHAVITGYLGENETLIIPKKLSGLPVTTIGENSFSYNNTIKEIMIPEGVTTIEAEAFMYCQNLKTVNLPESLATIGSSAFWQCGSLGGESFAIVLPDHVTSIGSGAFDTDFNSCTKKPSTHSIYCVPVCDLGTDTATALMNANLEFSIGDELYLRYGKETTTGGETGVFLRSFGADKTLLTSITIPDGVIGICDNVFSGCTKLVDINLPDSMIKFGAKCFAQCGNDSQDTVYFPVPYSLAEIDHGDYSGSFYGCTKIRYECPVNTPIMKAEANEFVVPENHDCVLRYTSFYNRADGKTYEGLLSLADYCGTNPEVVIPEGVQFIAQKAFSDRYHGHADGENTIVTSVEFPKSLIGIDDYAFLSCRALTSVTIPEQITYIQPGAFQGCYMLSEVVFHNGITTLDTNAFRECGKNIQGTFYYVLPDSISDVTYSNPFYDSPAVLAVNPNTDTAAWIAKLGLTFTMPDNTDFRFQFRDVSGTKRLYLTQYLGSSTVVNIPAGIYAIDGSVFKNKTAITKVVVPAGTIEIGSDAFRGCSNLTDITLPESLTTIKSCAFMESGTAHEGTYAIHLPDHLSDSMIVSGNGSSPFRDCPALLECTRGSDTAYMMSAIRMYDITFPNEHDFLYRYIKDNNVYRLYLYKYLGNAATVTIPDGIYCISRPNGGDASNWAFGNNTALTTVVIPEGTEIIEDSAFRGCTNLTNVTFPSTLKTLKNHAFRSCGSSSGARFYYELPAGITSITVDSADWDTFKECCAVLIVPSGSSTCTTLHKTYIHYHSRTDAEAYANPHWPESYKEGDPNSYRGNQ